MAKFIDNKYIDYSVYETPKYFVKNEVIFNKSTGRYKVKHTYRKKTKKLENKLNKTFGVPKIINRNMGHPNRKRKETRFWS